MTHTPRKILVTGATGSLGALTVAQLIERGHPATHLVAAGRTPEKLERYTGQGVDTAIIDYDRPETLANALAGIDTLVFISGSEVGQRARQHQNVITAAAEAGVHKIVYTSIARADTSANPLAPEHLATERALRDSGIAQIIARNNWYTENYVDAARQAATNGELVASAGDGRVASASRQDYAAALALLALDDTELGNTLELAGDTAWSYAELATVLTAVTGTPTTYRALTQGEHIALLQSLGLDEDTAQFVAGIDKSIAAGDLDVDDGTLAQLLGRPTTPLEAGLRAALAE